MRQLNESPKPLSMRSLVTSETPPPRAVESARKMPMLASVVGTRSSRSFGVAERTLIAAGECTEPVTSSESEVRLPQSCSLARCVRHASVIFLPERCSFSRRGGFAESSFVSAFLTASGGIRSAVFTVNSLTFATSRHQPTKRRPLVSKPPPEARYR